MKIISGGQTGADQAGLEAAFDFGIPTGGYAPAGYETLEGRNYKLRNVFGLEAIKGGYRKRTWMNVLHSDCTIRFAYDFDTPGEKCTKSAIEMYEKPYIDIQLKYPISNSIIEEVGNWIIKNNFQTINIAGNAQREKDVYTPVYIAMTKIFEFIKRKKNVYCNE